MVWTALIWFALRSIISWQVIFTANVYVTILDNHVHLMLQCMLPKGDDSNKGEKTTVHTAKILQNCFSEHEGEVLHLPWTHNRSISISYFLWEVLKANFRVFSISIIIKRTCRFLKEEW